MSEEQEPENPASGPQLRTSRGASFPRMTLPEAAQAVKDICKVGSSHSPGSMASVLGHSSANSGAFRQKLADLREFELVTGRGEVLELSALAMRVARPLSPEDADAAIRQAFLGCEIFAELYQLVEKGSELKLELLANMGIHKLHVRQHVAERFANCFAEGAVAAQLGERDNDSITLWERERPSGPSDVEPPPADSVAEEESTHTETADTVQALRQVWPLSPGSVELAIRFPEALPASAFAHLADAMTKIEELVVHLDEHLAASLLGDPSDS